MFGAGAPASCQVCDLEQRMRELTAAGFVECHAGHRQAFVDCGVPVETVCGARSVWVPCWAEQVRELFFGTHDLGPIISRCAVDPEFTDALLTVRVLAEKTHLRGACGDAHCAGLACIARSMRTFARASGVPIADLSHWRE